MTCVSCAFFFFFLEILLSYQTSKKINLAGLQQELR